MVGRDEAFPREPKECPGGPGKACGYQFVDETRDRSRRWCSGAARGNRTRLHRHDARLGATGHQSYV